MIAELAIQFRGTGMTCNGCGRNRETTCYTLRLDGKPIQDFALCDSCQDDGYVVKFTPKREPLYSAADRRRRVRTSQKLEQGLARDVGGRTQPGSGNQDAKDDVRVIGEWRLEHKYTDSVRSYTLLVEDLAAVVRHANLALEWPGLVLTFRKLARKFVIIPYEIFLEMVEKTHGAH